MNTVLLYGYFLASALVAAIGFVYFIRVSRGIVVPGGNGAATAKWLHGFCIGLGSVGIMASAPSIFSDNPHWFVDKIYFLMSQMISAFS